MSTYFPTSETARAERAWWVIDATGLPLGRVASAAARLLTGKEKACWSPHVDTGDFVVIVNAEKIVLTGRKQEQKLYRRHSGYPGGLHEISVSDLLAKKPERVMESAVRGMLPKTRLGRAMGRKLKVYIGSDHPHGAQGPQPWDVAGRTGARRAG